MLDEVLALDGFPKVILLSLAAVPPPPFPLPDDVVISKLSIFILLLPPESFIIPNLTADVVFTVNVTVFKVVEFVVTVSPT